MTVKGSRYQLWASVYIQEGEYAFRHLNPSGTNDKYLDADGESAGWKVVTRPWSGGDDQIWVLTRVGDRCPLRLHTCPEMFQCGQVDDYCGGTIACGGTWNGACTAQNPINMLEHTCNTEHNCECNPKTQCEGECGIEDDGCGGVVTCGMYGKCAQTNAETALPYTCLASSETTSAVATNFANKVHTCKCMPRTTCWSMAPAPGPPPCGDVPDGCGGKLWCGPCAPGASPAPAPAPETPPPTVAPGEPPMMMPMGRAPAPAPAVCVPTVTQCGALAEC